MTIESTQAESANFNANYKTRRRTITLKLTARSDGRFAKRINGRYEVFGKDGDIELARRELLEFLRLRSDAPIPVVESQPPATVASVVNPFLLAMQARVKDGSLSGGTFADYKSACEAFSAAIGRNALISRLSPLEFATVRLGWSGKLGAWALDRNVQAIRTMFNWGIKHRLIREQPFYGDAFAKSPTMQKRKLRRQRSVEGREHKFTRGELSAILKSKDLKGQLRCFVLLGINAGCYAKDCSDLVWSDLKQEGRLWIIDTDRHKTAVRRRFILWPELVEAIDARRKVAIKRKQFAPDQRIFLTLHGKPWHRENHYWEDSKLNGSGEVNSIAMMFNRLLTSLKIKRSGVGFGAFRHTHISAIGDHPDRNAAKLIRAHKFESIDEHYDFPANDRLKSVTDLARKRLYLDPLKQTRASTSRGRSASQSKSTRGRKRPRQTA